ncbi:hypothetical protein [Paractinoplanes lichenicola]|uniref:Uncharacterized protein n=1 Tax=Paractinoplanes lichenicola TaxID=2802976 RepID=A0ABS1VLP4_9ACTN|nr:hypothetical protein [Actinoplanes lichenicola]MBL7255640.1 hypothetical protein [Actinoplanes lichenicola]
MTEPEDPRYNDDDAADPLDDMLRMSPLRFAPPVVDGARIVSRALHRMRSIDQEFALHIEVSEPSDRGLANHLEAISEMEAGYFVAHLPDQRQITDRDAGPDDQGDIEGLTFSVGPVESRDTATTGRAAEAMADESVMVIYGVRTKVPNRHYDVWQNTTGRNESGHIVVNAGTARLRSGSRSSRRSAGQKASDTYSAGLLAVHGETEKTATYTFYGRFRRIKRV